MNHFKRFKQTLSLSIIASLFIPGVLAAGAFLALIEFTLLDPIIILGLAGLTYLLGTVVSYKILVATSSKPLEMVWQAVWHVSPERSNMPAPDLNKLRAGRELVSAMVMQIYDRASSAPVLTSGATSTASSAPSESAAAAPALAGGLIESIPLPLFILDKQWAIKDANNAAAQYLGLELQDIKSKSVHDILRMSFHSEDTLDAWLTSASTNKATDSRTWEQVKLSLDNNVSKKFDLAASFSKDNSAGNEVVLVLFDRSGTYSVQDQATTFIAMAVHELRTPLTMLRGYIELFEDELGDTLSPDHKEFMHKMSAASQNLSAFVSNVLNVARIEENQLTLTLTEANWPELLTQVVGDMQNRAQVRGKRLQLSIAPNLPTVGVDKISISEVVINLIDNAIKYSGQSPDIIVQTQMGQKGQVETTVTDHGAGIPESVLRGLFTKFYRSHRSKNAVGGSGLGLFLVKSMVKAHGGEVWATSKEGEGSTFGFSLQPFADIAAEQKLDGSDGIQRQANGWIKNHTLYRR